MNAGQDALEVSLKVGSDSYDEQDLGWQEQRAELVSALGQETDVRRPLGGGELGGKGVVEGVIIALGTAGVFKAAVDCLRAWLARDRTRRIELSWTVNGREDRIVLQGTAIPDEEFARLAELVRRRAAGGA